jgi:predicted 3-demethylubiquinone-9 3-methyltransferase (glyoxalase superfamily)
MKITVQTAVAAPVAEVWRAYTSPDDIKQWNAASDDWHTPAATVDLREGGIFSSRMEAKDGSMGFDFAGTYTKIIEHKLIAYSFGDRAAEVAFHPGPSAVAVRITFDSEPTHSIEQQRSGWQAILDNFARHVERRVAAAQAIAPCLWFETNALEAATYYTSVLGGQIDKVNRARCDTPSGKEGDVLFVEFTLRGQKYQALNGGAHDRFNDAISLSVPCEDQAEVDRLWAALTADGGRPVQCGWLKDKYGLSWQIVPKRLIELISDPDLARGKRVMQAMMQMVKLDVAKIEAAAKGH